MISCYSHFNFSSWSPTWNAVGFHVLSSPKLFRCCIGLCCNRVHTLRRLVSQITIMYSFQTFLIRYRTLEYDGIVEQTQLHPPAFANNFTDTYNFQFLLQFTNFNLIYMFIVGTCQRLISRLMRANSLTSLFCLRISITERSRIDSITSSITITTIHKDQKYCSVLY